MLRLVVLALCLAVGAAQANTVGCGGNSVSYAEVVTAPRAKAPKDAPRRAARGSGPIEVVPHSLCADLIEEPTLLGESQFHLELPLQGRRPRR